MTLPAFNSNILNKEEDLCPELASYLSYPDELPFCVLRHPLIYHVPYFEGMAALANFQLKAKRVKINELVKKGDPAGVIFFHERPYRLDAFVEYLDALSTDKLYWSILSSIWIDSENIPQRWELWKELLAETTDRTHFMSKWDWQAWSELPETITVYQGVSDSMKESHEKNNSEEVSWSLSEETAKFFANRFKLKNSPDGKLQSRQVNKNDIFALLTGRNENEVIILDGYSTLRDVLLKKRENADD